MHSTNPECWVTSVFLVQNHPKVPNWVQSIFICTITAVQFLMEVKRGKRKPWGQLLIACEKPYFNVCIQRWMSYSRRGNNTKSWHWNREVSQSWMQGSNSPVKFNKSFFFSQDILCHLSQIPLFLCCSFFPHSAFWLQYRYGGIDTLIMQHKTLNLLSRIIHNGSPSCWGHLSIMGKGGVIITGLYRSPLTLCLGDYTLLSQRSSNHIA